MSFRWLLRVASGLATLCMLAASVGAVAPTEEAIEKWKAEGILEKKLANFRAFKEAGGCSPVEYSQEVRDYYRTKMAAGADAIDTVHVVVILVDFSDWPYDAQLQAGTRDQFDSILFSNRATDPITNPTGSMTDYYLETSYGKLLVHGEVYGWYRMPNTYASYEGGNDGLGAGGPLLANHAVNAANNDIDYSQFNNPGMGVPIIVIHPGPGAETGAYGIWSHKSNILGTPVLDGVLLQYYNIVPEEFNGELQAIGVMCHEFGHTLGLPDLYDTDASGTEGVGRWSLMASGNYNNNQKSPSHFDPWCKRRIDPIPFIDHYDSLVVNRDSVAIPAVEFSSKVYQLKDNVAGGGEYWLVENRQPYGFDVGLPGFGLCIYHIDPAVSNNNNELRYMVAVEQADGLNSLAGVGSRGDAGDLWPGSTNNLNFHNLTVPDTKTNTGAVSQVGVWGISASDSVMYADMDVTYSRPYLTLASFDSLKFVESIGDGDGLFEEGETVAFHCRISNKMRSANEWYVSLSSDNPDIEFLDSNVVQPDVLNPIFEDVYQVNPVRFRLKTGAQPRITRFTMTVKADSVFNTGDQRYTQTFQFDKAMGPISIVLVDDDNGDVAEDTYEQSFARVRIPYITWTVASQGSPTISDLSKYSHVLWATGLRSTGGSLSASEITALKAFMDNGGNVALLSAGAVNQLRQSDSAFMRDYFHARYQDSLTNANSFYWGVIGNSLSEGVNFRALSSAPNEVKRPYRMQPANGGQIAFEVSVNYLPFPTKNGTVGVSYSGTHKSVLTSFGFEYVSLSDTLSGFAHRDSLLARVITFFGGNSTGIEDPDQPRLPKQFTLAQNYPNPFNPSTTIKYSIARSSGKSSLQQTHLAIYNLMGQRVKTLVDAEQGVGEYSVVWDGTDQAGRRVASGIYLYRLEREGKTDTRKMVLLK